MDPVRIAAAKRAIEAETDVKDMLFDRAAAVQWQVGVLNDGRPRFGYAEYICLLLREKGATAADTKVRIVDISKVANGVDFRSASLGTIACDHGKRLDDAPGARG